MLGSLALLFALTAAAGPSPDEAPAPGSGPAPSGEAAPAPSGTPAQAPAEEYLPRLPPPPPAPPPAPPPPLPPEPEGGPSAGGAAPGAPVPPLPPPPRPSGEPPPRKEETWLDVGHAFIEHRIFASVLRVDRFFSDERDVEAERSRSFVRWRNELRLTENASTPSYAASFSANLRLPGLNKQLRRLRIEILGQTREAITALLPGENPAIGDGTVPETEALRTADAGLGFRLWETLQTHGDLGAGIIAQLPPGAYGRLRIRFVEPLARRFLARQAVTGFWRTDTRFGSTGSAEVERPLARTVLARLSGTTTISEVSRGFEWLGDLSLLATFQSRIGVQLGASMNGATAAPVDVDRYRIYTRVRRDVYRKWLFVELEPEYAWPWSLEHGREALWAVTVRLEFQFQGTEAPPPAPPDAPEPADPPPLD